MTMECTQVGDAIICSERMVEISRVQDGEVRWCFVERKVTQHDRVVMAPAGPSYYGPNPSIRCRSCDTADADLFPGRIREWEG